MKDIIVILILLLIIGGASLYIRNVQKRSKKGITCVGCPCSGSCTSHACKSTADSHSHR